MVEDGVVVGLRFTELGLLRQQRRGWPVARLAGGQVGLEDGLTEWHPPDVDEGDDANDL